MKKIILALVGLVASGAASAAGGITLPYTFKEDTGNLASVQRGARNFMNYCAGCHSMKHMRYGRIGQDLEIPEEQLKAHLMFTSEKPGDPILTAMDAEEAAKWFGQAPPDLTVETRLRGPDWVYNFLMTFYLDEKKPTGVNNLILPGASMPHVLGELQGWQLKPAAAAGDAEASHGPMAGSGLELAVPGKLSADEYKKFVADTVNFMAYAAEPGKAQRISIGIGSILFLIVFTALAYALKREYWKDVH
jgi:ubiquinol-cytochrome c reductase cytochrome c1 subunit